MKRVASAALLLAFTLTGCTLPTIDQAKLKAIKAESQTLMATHPIKPPTEWVDVPKSEWPPVIASLHPFAVVVYEQDVNILVRPYFDGGCGYDVPRNGRDLSGAWYNAGQGVFWYGGLCPV